MRGSVYHFLKNETVYPVIIGVVLAFSLFTAFHAILRKRDPRSTLNWLLISLLLPGVGAMAYWIGGVNRIRTRASQWRLKGEWGIPGSADMDRLIPESCVPHVLPEWCQEMAPLIRLSRTVSRLPLLSGNRIVPFHNGEEAYPVMLKAINEARDFVYLTTYIFDTDKVGMDFVNALKNAAERGVDVRVLVDGFGRFYSFPTVLWKLRKSKVKAYAFLPPTSRLGLHFNLRNHRKLLLVDGEVAFTGGMNIGGRHMAANLKNARRVVDLQFSFEGPVLLQMENAFLADWYFVTRENPEKEHLHSKSGTRGNALCRALTAGPDDSFEKLETLYVGALSSAKHSIRIMTPYFVPDRMMISALITAALRGVSVEIILPELNNIPPIKWASRTYLWELLECGVRIFFQPPPFVHTKLLIVDDVFTLVGSMNIDPRSTRLNFELNVEIYDRALAGNLSGHYDRILAKSHEVSMKELDERALPVKLLDGLAKLFSPYL